MFKNHPKKLITLAATLASIGVYQGFHAYRNSDSVMFREFERKSGVEKIEAAKKYLQRHQDGDFAGQVSGFLARDEALELYGLLNARGNYPELIFSFGELSGLLTRNPSAKTSVRDVLEVSILEAEVEKYCAEVTEYLDYGAPAKIGDKIKINYQLSGDGWRDQYFTERNLAIAPGSYGQVIDFTTLSDGGVLVVKSLDNVNEKAWTRDDWDDYSLARLWKASGKRDIAWYNGSELVPVRYLGQEQTKRLKVSAKELVGLLRE